MTKITRYNQINNRINLKNKKINSQRDRLDLKEHLNLGGKNQNHQRLKINRFCNPNKIKDSNKIIIRSSLKNLVKIYHLLKTNQIINLNPKILILISLVQIIVKHNRINKNCIISTKKKKEKQRQIKNVKHLIF